MTRSSRHRIFLLWILPALLFILTIAASGSFFETNDDLVISFLLRGETTGLPVTNLLYFFHGIGSVIAALYQALPALPWYGLVLYTLLFFATVQAAIFLFELKKTTALPPAYLLVPVAALFLGAWQEHIMWFSFVRVSVLLSGASVLLYAILFLRKQKPSLLLIFCMAGFFIALCIRPKGAYLGAGLALPALWWLLGARAGIKRISLAVLPFLAIAGLFQVFLALTVSDQEKEIRKINKQKSLISDYDLYAAAPKNEPDSLALLAVKNWMLADKEVVNAELFNRAGQVNFSQFLTDTAPAKARQIAAGLVKDYFLLMLLQALIIISLMGRDSALPRRKIFLLWQLFFWLFLLCFGTYYKLPARISTSAVTVHMLALTGIWFLYSAGKARFQKISAAILLAAAFLQLYKISNRSVLQRQAQLQHEQFLQTFSTALPPRTTVITANMGNRLSSLSPFRNYSPGPYTVLNLTGWPTLLPYYQEHLLSNSGHGTYAAAINFIGDADQTIWFLPDHMPEFISEYFRIHHSHAFTFYPLKDSPETLAANGYMFYRVIKKEIPE